MRAYLTGDLHHYRRHEETPESAAGQPPVQKIIAGGGGAFLHPTHEEDVSLLQEEAVTEDARGPQLRGEGHLSRHGAARSGWPGATCCSRC